MKMCTPTRWLGARAVGSGRTSDCSCFCVTNFRNQPIITTTISATPQGTRRPFSVFCSYSSPFLAASSSSMPYDKELAAAKKAATLAARLCQKVQKALLQSDVHSKSDKSPVTVADYGSQALVSFVLERELPSEPFSLVAEEDSGDLRKESGQETLKRITELVNDTLASEESDRFTALTTEDVLRAIDNGKSEGGSIGRHWVLDPIDGTKGFVRGDQYAIALGLLHEGKVVLGVLACPNLPLTSIGNNQQSSSNEVGCLFFAKVGDGAYMQSLNGSTHIKVHVTDTGNPEEASFFESFEAAHSSHDLSSSIAEKLGVKAPPVRIDSQAKYGALSRGDGAIYLRFPHKGYREKIWDHAAGSIVVTEAGGIVTDAAGNPLDFSKGKFLDVASGIIVTNQKLMPSLLRAVKEALNEKASSL
ncbi:3'(2'),5'-bisphosphate nucleotidase 1 [Arachis hypogaea]|uniref:3'(2'),5'-bisphosphate nucleotidase 1 n=1 Tax=Arachis hypogaea TaxID=3818 RepID=UPI000DECE78C|nr:SAL1 phosphatase [Arachis hypogaea]QHO03910.1 SAL1 phosphatase [Arachis hypogaea]